MDSPQTPNELDLYEIEEWCNRGVPADNAPITSGECLSLIARVRVGDARTTQLETALTELLTDWRQAEARFGESDLSCDQTASNVIGGCVDELEHVLALGGE